MRRAKAIPVISGIARSLAIEPAGRLHSLTKKSPQNSQPDRMTPGSSGNGSLIGCRRDSSRITSEKLTVATR
jgi:hypothetical protein